MADYVFARLLPHLKNKMELLLDYTEIGPNVETKIN